MKLRINPYYSFLMALIVLSMGAQTFGQQSPIPRSGLYLILASDSFLNSPSLLSFKTFREQEFTVQIVAGSSIGSTKNDFRDYIRNLMPDYVLLVGKYGDFPTHFIPYPAEVESYQYYVSTSTTGHPMPDIPLGLFFAEDEDELANIVHKTMSYENNSTHYPKEYYGHAGSNAVNPPWPITFNEDILTEMNDRYFNPAGFQFTLATANDSTPNDAWTDINMINSGIHFMIYHGHGQIDKWSFGMGGTAMALSQLNNQIFPIIFSFSCLTGTFSGVANGDTNLCFAQRITAAEYGAVAFFGSYNIAGRGMNQLLEGVVNGLFNDSVPPRLGDVLTYAYANETNSNTVNLYYPTVSVSERIRAAWQFHLFGDPALKIRNTHSAINEQIVKFQNITIHPNPTKGVFHIVIAPDKSPVHINIYALDGHVLWSGINKTTIDISSLPSGIYIIQIKRGDQVAYRKLIKTD